MVKAKLLIFDTDFTAKEAVGEVKDGTVVLKDKEWLVDKTKPFIIKDFLGRQMPLYLLKWNSVTPMNFETKVKRIAMKDESGKEYMVETEELVPIEPKFDESIRVTPEILKMTRDTRFLKGMGKYASEPSFPDWLPKLIFIIIVLAGGFLIYYLIASGQLKPILGI
jgi:hypothetical protein